MERINDINSLAAELYDDGCRSDNRYCLIEEYNIHPDDVDAICEILAELEEEEVERIEDITGTAAALYDGGWRAEDRDQMIKEYDLHPDDADAICEKLAEYEANEDK